jgi:Rad3-related DNA helicase
MSKLLDYQIPHVDKLIRNLTQYNVCVDASDTGTGKTYSALYVAKKLNLRPFIVCPKCVISSWKKVAKTIGVDPIYIINYDQIIAPYIINQTQQDHKIRILNDYLEKTKLDNEQNHNPEQQSDIVLPEFPADMPEHVRNDILANTGKVAKIKSAKTKSTKTKSATKLTKTKTNLPNADQQPNIKQAEKLSYTEDQVKLHLQFCKKKFIPVVDEAKVALNDGTDEENEEKEAVDATATAKATAKAKGKKKTVKPVADKLIGFEWSLPNNAIVIFDEVHRCKNKKTLHFQLLKSLREYIGPNFKCLILSATIADKINYFGPVGYTLGWYTDIDKFKIWLNKKAKDTGFSLSKTIHHLLFPFYGSRMRIAELGDLFPHNQILPECYDMDNANQIEAQYRIIQKALEDLRAAKANAQCILEIILRARQMIEMLKYPTFCELIDDHLESGLSVVVFVNFNDTMNKLAQTFETTSVIHGKQTEAERQKVIEDFQSNRTTIIIANIKAGGVGISLHDIHGGHPRVSIISPTWSAQDTMQTLGRIHRAEGKTPAIQKFVFCAGTIEEYICDKLREKLDDMSMINDGVLHPFPKLETDPETDSETDNVSDNDTDANAVVETKKKTKTNQAKKGKSCSDYLNI